MHASMYQHLRSVAIGLLGPDADPDSEYVRALVELTISATATSFDDLDGLREELENDLRLSCEPTQPLWLVTAYHPKGSFAFEWAYEERVAREAAMEGLEHGQPGTRVALKKVTVPTSIAKGTKEGVTDWIEDHEDDLDGAADLFSAVVA